MAITEETLTAKPNAPNAHGPAEMILALIAAMRPKQWTKNLFVFVAIIFTNNLPSSIPDARWRLLGLTICAFVLYCLVSGGTYLMNDVIDREQDRLHPEKRNRPIASGRLPWQLASAASAVCCVGGVSASFLINRGFGFITLAYLALQISYTFVLKHHVLIDVFAIAAGFVFRAVAGGLALGVPISVWLLVCTLQLSLFLGFGKRRHELVSLAENARSHRRNLEFYTIPLLDQLIAIVLAGLVVSYAVYTIQSPTAVSHPALVITLPNVMYGIFRYLYLIQVEHKGGSPESILLEDRPMQINLVLWVIEAVGTLKFI